MRLFLLIANANTYTQSHWRCSKAAKELSPMSLGVLGDWGE